MVGQVHGLHREGVFGHYSLASIVGVEFKDMMLDNEGSDRCM